VKPFRFRMQRVLTWKEKRAEVEQARLDTLLAELARLRDRMKALEHELSTAGATAITRPGLSGSDLHALQSYYYELENQIRRLAGEITEAARRVAEQRQVLIAARMEVRLFEKLRERDLSEWKVEFNAEIEALSAESVLARTARRLRQPSGS